MSEPLILIGLGLVAAYWLTAMKVKEAAVRAARAACARHGVQLLDETVALQRFGFGRDSSGRLRLRRIYDFEFSSGPELRRNGSVEVLGSRVISLYLDLDDHTLYEQTLH